jgi:hypothetical protein
MDKCSCLKNDTTPRYSYLNFSVHEVRLTTLKGMGMSDPQHQTGISPTRHDENR